MLARILLPLALFIFHTVPVVAEMRDVTGENGVTYKVDSETHQVYTRVERTATESQTLNGVTTSQSRQEVIWVTPSQKAYFSPELNRSVEIDPGVLPPLAPPPPSLRNLGVAPPTHLETPPPSPPPSGRESNTAGMLQSKTVGPSQSSGYTPSYPLDAGQAAAIQGAVNEIFGPGVPVRDYSGIQKQAGSAAAEASRIHSELVQLKVAHLTTAPRPMLPSAEELKRYARPHSLIDVPSLPDPEDSALPYRLQSEGEHRESLARLYKHLYKTHPDTGKRQDARELGLISVEEADQSYLRGEKEEGRFFQDAAEGFLDVAIGLDPVTGVARSTYELLRGRNLVTGVKLTRWEYGFAALNIVTIGGEGLVGAAVKGLGRLVSRGAKLVRVAEETAEGVKFAEKALESAVLLARENPDLGRKLDYLLGRATGSIHNVERSQEMLRQMERIGIFDTNATRTYLADYLKKVLQNPQAVSLLQENGRVVRESLLTGPRGVIKVESVWEGSKLITAKIFGKGI